jgi:hypothetical protein
MMNAFEQAIKSKVGVCPPLFSQDFLKSLDMFDDALGGLSTVKRLLEQNIIMDLINDNSNQHLFVKNAPINLVDYLDLEVTATFDSGSMSFSVTDKDTTATAGATAFTGGMTDKSGKFIPNGLTEDDFGGPTPKGDYFITDEPSGRNPGWFALFKDDLTVDDKTNWGSRSGFRLHKGTVSAGCITICNRQNHADQKWKDISTVIKGTKVTKTIKYGGKTLNVYGKITVK